ncbi:MAG: penicillin acylase family protein, partial [Bacteriovoracia bacterium]
MMRHCLMALVLCGTVFSSFAAERCEVWEDPQRITHVRAQSEESFSYCFGYLHGRDRSWMMDHFRRVA